LCRIRPGIRQAVQHRLRQYLECGLCLLGCEAHGRQHGHRLLADPGGCGGGRGLGLCGRTKGVSRTKGVCVRIRVSIHARVCCAFVCAPVCLRMPIQARVQARIACGAANLLHTGKGGAAQTPPSGICAVWMTKKLHIGPCAGTMHSVQPHTHFVQPMCQCTVHGNPMRWKGR